MFSGRTGHARRSRDLLLAIGPSWTPNAFSEGVGCLPGKDRAVHALPPRESQEGRPEEFGKPDPYFTRGLESEDSAWVLSSTRI